MRSVCRRRWTRKSLTIVNSVYDHAVLTLMSCPRPAGLVPATAASLDQLSPMIDSCSYDTHGNVQMICWIVDALRPNVTRCRRLVADVDDDDDDDDVLD